MNDSGAWRHFKNIIYCRNSYIVWYGEVREMVGMQKKVYSRGQRLRNCYQDLGLVASISIENNFSRLGSDDKWKTPKRSDLNDGSIRSWRYENFERRWNNIN